MNIPSLEPLSDHLRENGDIHSENHAEEPKNAPAQNSNPNGGVTRHGIAEGMKKVGGMIFPISLSLLASSPREPTSPASGVPSENPDPPIEEKPVRIHEMHLEKCALRDTHDGHYNTQFTVNLSPTIDVGYSYAWSHPVGDHQETHVPNLSHANAAEEQKSPEKHENTLSLKNQLRHCKDMSVSTDDLEELLGNKPVTPVLESPKNVEESLQNALHSDAVDAYLYIAESMSLNQPDSFHEVSVKCAALEREESLASQPGILACEFSRQADPVVKGNANETIFGVQELESETLPEKNLVLGPSCQESLSAPETLEPHNIPERNEIPNDTEHQLSAEVTFGSKMLEKQEQSSPEFTDSALPANVTPVDAVPEKTIPESPGTNTESYIDDTAFTNPKETITQEACLVFHDIQSNDVHFTHEIVAHTDCNVDIVISECGENVRESDLSYIKNEEATHPEKSLSQELEEMQIISNFDPGNNAVIEETSAGYEPLENDLEKPLSQAPAAIENIELSIKTVPDTDMSFEPASPPGEETVILDDSGEVERFELCKTRFHTNVVNKQLVGEKFKIRDQMSEMENFGASDDYLSADSAEFETDAATGVDGVTVAQELLNAAHATEASLALPDEYEELPHATHGVPKNHPVEKHPVTHAIESNKTANGKHTREEQEVQFEPSLQEANEEAQTREHTVSCMHTLAMLDELEQFKPPITENGHSLQQHTNQYAENEHDVTSLQELAEYTEATPNGLPAISQEICLPLPHDSIASAQCTEDQSPGNDNYFPMLETTLRTPENDKRQGTADNTPTHPDDYHSQFSAHKVAILQDVDNDFEAVSQYHHTEQNVTHAIKTDTDNAEDTLQLGSLAVTENPPDDENENEMFKNKIQTESTPGEQNVTLSFTDKNEYPKCETCPEQTVNFEQQTYNFDPDTTETSLFVIPTHASDQQNNETLRFEPDFLTLDENNLSGHEQFSADSIDVSDECEIPGSHVLHTEVGKENICNTDLYHELQNAQMDLEQNNAQEIQVNLNKSSDHVATFPVATTPVSDAEYHFVTMPTKTVLATAHNTNEVDDEVFVTEPEKMRALKTGAADFQKKSAGEQADSMPEASNEDLASSERLQQETNVSANAKENMCACETPLQIVKYTVPDTHEVSVLQTELQNQTENYYLSAHGNEVLNVETEIPKSGSNDTDSDMFDVKRPETPAIEMHDAASETSIPLVETEKAADVSSLHIDHDVEQSQNELDTKNDPKAPNEHIQISENETEQTHLDEHFQTLNSPPMYASETEAYQEPKGASMPITEQTAITAARENQTENFGIQSPYTEHEQKAEEQVLQKFSVDSSITNHNTTPLDLQTDTVNTEHPEEFPAAFDSDNVLMVSENGVESAEVHNDLVEPAEAPENFQTHAVDPADGKKETETDVHSDALQRTDDEHDTFLHHEAPPEHLTRDTEPANYVEYEPNFANEFHASEPYDDEKNVTFENYAVYSPDMDGGSFARFVEAPPNTPLFGPDKETNAETSIRNAFKIFDYAENETLNICDIGNVFRCLNLNPTEEDVVTIMEKLDFEGDFVQLEDFLPVAREVMQSEKFKPVNETEMLEAFAEFDPERTGFITVEKLKEILTTMGEKLSDEEIELFLTYANVCTEDGLVDYEKCAKILCDLKKRG